MLLCFMVFSVGVCSAEIFQRQDEFTGGNTIRSNYDIKLEEQLEWLSFYKNITKKTIRYGINADLMSFSRNFGLSDKVIRFNIDGDYTYDLLVLNWQEMKISADYLYMLNYSVPLEAVDKLKNANRVALRFTRNNGFQFVYVLPDEVLAEWKQVIATEK